MKIGDKLKGRITGIQPYGAFRRMLPIWTGEALHHLKKKK